MTFLFPRILNTIYYVTLLTERYRPHTCMCTTYTQFSLYVLSKHNLLFEVPTIFIEHAASYVTRQDK